MRTWIVIATVAAAMLGAAPAQAAISASLAKQCREMMVKAYPLTAWAIAPSAENQRAYFQECISRQGKMDRGSEPTTTGSGRRPE
jgi:hypothetical protein